MKFSRLLVTTMVCAGIGLAVPGHAAIGQEPTQRKAFVLPHVLEALDQSIAQPAPPALNDADARSYAAETEWLKSARTRIEQLSSQAGVTPAREASSGMATGRRQYQPIIIRKDIEALKATLEQESRQFNTLSNASKARHDIAMNAIRNMKA